MAVINTCPHCNARVPARDELVGKRVKCPKCGDVFTVLSAKEQAEVDQGEGPIVEARLQEVPQKKKKKPAFMPEEDDDEDRPKKRLKYKRCPKCGSSHVEKVDWTFWGSYYGPALFCHVRCEECGYGYNGKTGRSNLIPAIFFVAIPLILIIALLIAIVWIIHKRTQGQDSDETRRPAPALVAKQADLSQHRFSPTP